MTFPTYGDTNEPAVPRQLAPVEARIALLEQRVADLERKLDEHLNPPRYRFVATQNSGPGHFETVLPFDEREFKRMAREYKAKGFAFVFWEPEGYSHEDEE